MCLIQFLGTSEGLVGREYIQLGGTIESGVCSFHAGGVVRGMICDRFGWWMCAAIDDERLTRGRSVLCCCGGVLCIDEQERGLILFFNSPLIKNDIHSFPIPKN